MGMEEEETNMKVQIAVLVSQMGQLTTDMQEVKRLLTVYSDKYLTKDEFQIYKSLIMGTVTAILLAFLGGLASLLWKS